MHKVYQYAPPVIAFFCPFFFSFFLQSRLYLFVSLLVQSVLPFCVLVSSWRSFVTTELVSLLRLKNRHGHWLRWMSTDTTNTHISHTKDFPFFLLIGPLQAFGLQTKMRQLLSFFFVVINRKQRNSILRTTFHVHQYCWYRLLMEPHAQSQPQRYIMNRRRSATSSYRIRQARHADPITETKPMKKMEIADHTTT